MKRYPAYKRCGMEFLGDVPESWKVMKLSHFVEKITNGYVGPTRDIMTDAGIPYIQGIHIKNNTVKFTPDGYFYVTEEWSNDHPRSILREDDVLVVQTGTIGEIGIVPKELEGANCHALIILRANSNYGTGKYLLWLLSSRFGYHSLFSIRTGDILHHLNATRVRHLHIPVPHIDEQVAISNFLDHKTNFIDALIEKKQKQIELLQDQRAAVINQAVTKGLNADVKMKNSGIEWLGKVPEHWEVVKLSHWFRSTSGSTPSRTMPGFYGGDIPWVKTGELLDAEIHQADENITREAVRASSLTLLPKNTLLIAMYGQGQTRGRTGLLKVEATVNQACLAILPNPKRAHPEYIQLWFISQYSKLRYISDARNATQPNLNAEIVKSQKVVIPPLSEQKQIMASVRIETNTIENTIARFKRKIELLKEYRTTLISEAVTGKIDVRDEAIPT